ncbi:MAG: zinc-binding dehydrogenase [Phycisphaerales bacterium]|nr:zinc-binding dehydrogenase [Phycisphaerales bacterium]
MKASLIHEFGPPDVFRYEDVPTPEPAPGHVVIKVAACGLNRYDLYLRMGGIRKDIPMPHVMGADITGTVAAVGAGVTNLKTGQRVIAAPGFPFNPAEWDFQPINHAPSYAVVGTLQWGGYAEYVHLPARFVLPDETNVPQDALATIPLCLVTAMHAVKSLGQVTRGSSVLIQAGASGSGSLCIQVAKALGGRVITTVGSEDKIAFVRAMGADEVVRRDVDDQAKRVLDWTAGQGVDVVIDNVGSAVFDANMKSLRLGGTFVNFGLVSGYKVQFNLRDFFFRQHVFKGSMMGTMDELREGLRWVAEGKIKPVLDRTFQLRDAAAAHAYVDSRAVRGSVVLIP